jgi:ATP-binding cassette subfamily B protein
VAVDTGCVPTLVNGVVLSLLGSLLTLAVLMTIMWQLDRSLALVAAAVALPMGLAMRRLGPRMSERAYRQQQLEGEVWSVAEQALAALPVVQAFAREEHEGLRFRRVSGRTLAAFRRLLAAQLQFKLGVDAAIALGTAALMLIGGWQVLAGHTSIGTLVVFFSYLSALYAPLVSLAYLSSTFAGAAASARRVVEVLDADETVRDAPGARPLPVPPRGDVRLERVVFGYEPGRAVLQDVDLQVRPGEMLALVGSTGAGKTTLVSLIPRLFDPWEGRVLVEGMDVRQATLASVRERVALVLQDPFLLQLSVADNIAYARPGVSRSEIVAAAEAANADEFIRRLPRGYDEVLGEGGGTLSGGERQRIAIARALLRDAPVLILDEPSSALDAKTEARVMEAIERLTRGRTTILIAHRLSTVRRADRVVVLEAGRIVESGSHEELLARRGSYLQLHLAAFRR